MIPWIMQRKMNPNTDSQDMAYMRRGRPQETEKGTQEQNEESQAAKASVCWWRQKVSWRLDYRRRKDSSVTLSVVIMQIFHEKINKLRIKKKKE